MNPPPSSLSTSQPFTFGSNNNVPFLLPPMPVPHTQPPSWVPPPLFSPEKAFPSQPDVKDIDMADLSPLKNGDYGSEQIKHGKDGDERPVATGGMRRVYNQRKKRQEHRLVVARSRRGGDEDEVASPSESEEEGTVTPLTQNTSNHYTLNMPAPAPIPSDLPYVLLGYFNFLRETKMKEANLYNKQLPPVSLQPKFDSNILISVRTVYHHGTTRCWI